MSRGFWFAALVALAAVAALWNSGAPRVALVLGLVVGLGACAHADLRGRRQ